MRTLERILQMRIRTAPLKLQVNFSGILQMCSTLKSAWSDQLGFTLPLHSQCELSVPFQRIFKYTVKKVSDFPGDGKIANLFLQCTVLAGPLPLVLCVKIKSSQDAPNRVQDIVFGRDKVYCTIPQRKTKNLFSFSFESIHTSPACVCSYSETSLVDLPPFPPRSFLLKRSRADLRWRKARAHNRMQSGDVL